jgi:hypothetical protein
MNREQLIRVLSPAFSTDAVIEKRPGIFQVFLPIYHTDGDAYEIYPAVLQFVQGITCVSNLDILKKETVKSLFFEDLRAFVLEELREYKPEEDVSVIENRSELTANFVLHTNSHKNYVFGINNGAQARLAVICHLEAQKLNLRFRSIGVYEDFEVLPKKDKLICLNTPDKQFTTLRHFQMNVKEYLKREANLNSGI